MHTPIPPFVSEPPPPAPLRGATVADELLVRLARLEEQMRHLARAVDRLASRDAELDVSLRAMSDRFTAALADQAALFRNSLHDVTARFVSREDWAFWKSVLTAALFALIAYGWQALTGSIQRLPGHL